MIFLPHLVIFTFFFFFLFPVPHNGCTQKEKNSLLIFQSNLTFSSNNTPLTSWFATDDCCQWEGVSCDSNGSVTALSLAVKGLGGRISDSLAALPQLTRLNLSYNRFSGELPAKILFLPRLASMDVSFNLLSGRLPPAIPRSSEKFSLQVLNLSSNSFAGPFPDLGSLARFLTVLNISNNSFSGPIPSSICRLSHTIRVMDLSCNQFSGDISQGLSSCSALTEFRAGMNNLWGGIQQDLFHMASLQLLSLPFNQLSGTLEEAFIAKLMNLTILDLSSNQLTGKLPASISRMPFLEQLILHDNQLSGTLPPELANCTKLKNLNLRFNRFDGSIAVVNFSSLSSLNMVDLGNNKFIGDVPTSLYSLKSLKALRLSMNSINGTIVPAMAEMPALSYLSLSGDGLENITAALQILKDCRNLSAIIISKNFIKEAIPTDIEWEGRYFQNLQVLSLGACELTGKIPHWLSKLDKLLALDLSNNRLTGPIPAWLGSLPCLFYLDLSGNLLSGEIPPEITGLRALTMDQFETRIDQGFLDFPVFVLRTNGLNLQYNQLKELPPTIKLGNNSLHGRILPQIGRVKNLHVLDLSQNDFSGIIPAQLCNLTNLESLELSYNNLSGMIPSLLNNLHFLASFNVAHNNLEGPIPSGGQFDSFPIASYEGNAKLCGKLLPQKCTNKSGDGAPLKETKNHVNKRFSIALGICIGGGLVVVGSALVIICIMRARQRRSNGGNKIKSNAVSAGSLPSLPFSDSTFITMPNSGKLPGKKLLMSDILKATSNFGQENIIGSGGFGMVYKATLLDGSKLAIKKLSGEMCLMEREFRAEVEALSSAQHENLVSLQGYCMHGSSWILIYSYMENGSLDYWLHEKADGGGSVLEWPTRLKIAQGASRGLRYIHQTCDPHIVHRDIKSSNILLDEHFEAHVADFGLSRLILPYNTHVTTELVGTLGYIPPEYSQAWVATLRGDMYSFGVVLLELLTGRRPVEIFKSKDSSDLVAWVNRMRNQGKQSQVFDLLLRGKGFEEQMLKVLEVACMCVHNNPFKRPSIGEVVAWLEIIGIGREMRQ